MNKLLFLLWTLVAEAKYLASAIMEGNYVIIGFTSLQYVKEAVGCYRSTSINIFI